MFCMLSPTQDFLCFAKVNMRVSNEHVLLCLYSWIGHAVRTQKTISRETKRATTDLNIWFKSYQRGASTGGVQKNHIFLFGELFKK